MTWAPCPHGVRTRGKNASGGAGWLVTLRRSCGQRPLHLLRHQPLWHLSPPERTVAVPLAHHVPPFLSYGQRQRGPQVLHLAEASNSLALIGLVAVAGPVQIRGHRGLAALSMRHKSTLGAMLRRCNLVHCVGPPCLALVAQGASYAAPFSWAKAVVEEPPTSCCPSVMTNHSGSSEASTA